jgi:ABC-type nitrate/sulfonate/bicarbonate transport system permease component
MMQNESPPKPLGYPRNSAHIQARRIRSIAPVAVGLLTWWFAAHVIGENTLPDPRRAALLFAETAFQGNLIAAQGGGSHGMAPHVWSTFWEVSVGASAGCLAGVLIALVASQYVTSMSLTNKLVEIGRTIPPLIFVPFVAGAFGVSDWVRFLSIAFYSAMTISIYALNASVGIQQRYFAMASLLGASRFRRVLTVQVPAILPHLLGPLRLVYAFSLGISVVVEYLAADSGIGHVIRELVVYSRADLIVVGVIWTLLLSLVFDALLVLALSAGIRWTDRRTLIYWLSR